MVGVAGSLEGEHGLPLVVLQPGEVLLGEREVPAAGPDEVLIRPEVGRPVRDRPGHRGRADRSRLHSLPAGPGARVVAEAVGSTGAVLSALAAARRGST
jgi:hypothetical protein